MLLGFHSILRYLYVTKTIYCAFAEYHRFLVTHWSLVTSTLHEFLVFYFWFLNDNHSPSHTRQPPHPRSLSFARRGRRDFWIRSCMKHGFQAPLLIVGEGCGVRSFFINVFKLTHYSFLSMNIVVREWDSPFLIPQLQSSL